MAVMSAYYVAVRLGQSTNWVYGVWSAMGIIMKDGNDNWILTEEGIQAGGRMSRGSKQPVPMFGCEVIEQMLNYKMD